LEGAKVHAVGNINAPLNAEKGIEGIRVGVAEGRELCWIGSRRYFGVGGVVAFVAGVPEFGLDAAEAALGPLGGDEGIDEGELVGVGGVVVEEECGGEGIERGGVFAGDDVGMGVDTGLEGVERGGGFAFGGSGAGGFLRVEPIGVDLCLGRHARKPRAGRACGYAGTVTPSYSQLSMRVREFRLVTGWMLLRE
jgi:hypothetical protein